MYGKLFLGMYDGTLATVGPWQALVTFQQLIILADKEGIVDMTPEAIARRTTIPLEIIVYGLETLEKPDPQSRTPDEEGRRIIRLSDSRPWGWRIVNYAHYREIRSAEDRRAYMKNYQRMYREKRKQFVNNINTRKQNKPIAEAEVKVEVKKKRNAVSDKSKRPKQQTFEEWWEEIKKNPAYANIDCDRELGKMEAWLTTPRAKGRKLTKSFALRWLNKIDPGEQAQGNVGNFQTCTRRVEIKGRLKSCCQPATQGIGKSPMCEKCFKDYQNEQENLKEKGIVNAN